MKHQILPHSSSAEITEDRTVVVMRGISGSGKSSVIRAFSFQAKHQIKVFSADHFFMRGDQYVFEPAKIGRAHAACLRGFTEALVKGEGVLVVDNTNTTNEEMAPYLKLAQAFGFKVVVIELTPPVVLPDKFEDRNVHGVPRQVLEGQLARFERLSPLNTYAVDLYLTRDVE